jgi:small subunit ribosomal protein S6
MARLYETVVLVDANREDAAIEATVQKFQDIITAGGEIIRTDRWGKRRIAYDIAGRSHADYTVYYYHATKNTLVFELERFLRLDETILRFLTVVDNPVGVPPLQQHATEVDVPDDADLSDKED